MMIEKLINSPADLHELASSFRKTHPIFRGLSDSSFQLIPRFGRSIIKNREFRSKNPTFSYVIDQAKENVVLNQFKILTAPHLTSRPVNEWEWLAIAQHHGLPTRLMDWTSNPLVAAYFATSYSPSKSDTVIYVISNKYTLKEISFEKSPFDLDKPAVFTPRHTTQRITAQSGVFVINPIVDEPFCCDGMEKWIVSKKCRIEMEIMLCRYGITHASMFPGLDGIAKFLVSDYGL
ncbi:FRG domain-containing protein [Pelotalea chapellei]|uniref:FRG domain-containing protein n=1 Tax=Pelotalea chapellei TaxID=44671 RepID=A0ABS5U847_9BACT|nr:FRG domain-containing protein [Pelotalea chapellei]MBT1071833.1 FRG domain-containing protein [Pelotalea chapellei]